MATKQIGPIQFQGKLDTLVGRSTRKGYMSLGMKAKKITNPNTPKQVRARTEFACAQAYGNGIPAGCLAGLRPYSRAIKASIRNTAAKLCYAPDVMETNTAEKGGFTSRIPVEKYFFSRGTMPNVNTSQQDISADDPLTVKIGWQNTEVENALALCHVIIYNADTKVFLHKIVEASEKTATFKVSNDWNGSQAHVYIYTQYPPQDPDGFAYYHEFASASSAEREAIETKSMYSNTKYVGKVTIS